MHLSCFRSAHPLGLPEEFAFVTVLRMDGSTVQKNWNIWQMQDLNGDEQLSVGLNGLAQSLEFTFIALDKQKQSVVFSLLPLLFNSRWHEIVLSVSRRLVTLFVDCVKIESQNIPTREKVHLDGYTLLGKLKDNSVIAVPVSILWRNGCTLSTIHALHSCLLNLPKAFTITSLVKTWPAPHSQFLQICGICNTGVLVQSMTRERLPMGAQWRPTLGSNPKHSHALSDPECTLRICKNIKM